MFRLIIAIAVLTLLLGCSGNSNDDAGGGSQQAPAAAAPPASDRGIGPITELALGPVDETKAAEGAKIFETKCAVCHKFEERYVGPALAGVTERRRPEWILNMILNPDQMIKEDPQARALFVEYLTPMTFQNVTREDAEAILEHLRVTDSSQ